MKMSVKISAKRITFPRFQKGGRLDGQGVESELRTKRKGREETVGEGMGRWLAWWAWPGQ